MGRATIISGGTDGRYLIEMDYGVAQRDALIAKIDLDLYQLGLRKTWQEDQLEEVELGLVSLQTEQAAFINAYVAASKLIPPNKALTDSIKVQLDAKTAEVTRQQLIVQNARNALHMTTAQIKSAELDKAKLNLAEVTEQRQAWCADLTENATGAVATLEVPGESALILVKPSAPEATITDGRLIAREVQTPAQVFWNAAVLPGWQKFLPTYRWGTITALDQDADKCTVELAEAKSSANQLNVNQAATLQNVPVVYMTCNAAAFEVGDRVVVEFQANDWAQPRVIGFVDYPKACAGGALYCIPADATALYGWSPPVLDGEGQPINGGKGSIAIIGNAAAPEGTVRDGTNRTAGVKADIRSNVLGVRTTRGARADVDGLPASGPTELGNNDDPLSYSSMGRYAYEWISQNGQYVCTAFDTCRVNGADIGSPSPGTPYRVFVPSPGLTGGAPTAFCLAEQYGTQFHLYRRPVAGGPSVAWTWVSTIDIMGVDTTPVLSINELQKIITNDDASILTMWFASGSEGYGCVDLAIPSGSSTFVSASKSFSKNYDTTIIGTPDEGDVIVNPKVDTFTVQISVDYVGNAKSFATLSGTRTHYLDPINPYEPTSIRELVTADFWGQAVTIADYLIESSQTASVTETPIGGGVIERHEQSHFELFATLESRAVYAFGGAGDPILFTFKNYARTQLQEQNYEYKSTWPVYPGEYEGFAEIPEMAYGTAFIHGGSERTLTEWTRPAYRHSWDHGAVSGDGIQNEVYPPETGGENWTFWTTYNNNEWITLPGSPTGGYWVPGIPGIGYGTLSDVQRHFSCLFGPYSAATRFNTGPNYHTPVYDFMNGVNLRCFNGFAIMSLPATVEGDEGFRTSTEPRPIWPVTVYRYPPDSSIAMTTDAWHTWCSQDGALTRFALPLGHNPPLAGRLKYLQLGGR